MKKTLLLSLILINLGWPIGAKYLIITHDNFYEAILPLAQWKHKKGVPTKVVKLSDLNATPESIARIKNYIVNAYNTWTPRPEYVLLVGSPTYIKSFQNKYDDYFGDMTGDGKLEIPVGRFPCDSVSQCSLHVAKTLGYERTPYMTDQTWFKKGTTIILEDHSTYPPTQQPDTVYWNDARYVHELWRNAGYTLIDSLSKGLGHTSTDVVNSINDGRAFMLFRGQSVTNWWSPFALDPTLTSNGFKLPILVSATCATMTLSSNNYLGDRVMNAGTVQNPKAMVGFVGTTVVASGTGLARNRGMVAQGFFGAIFKDNLYKLGDALKRAKFLIDSIQPTGYIFPDRYREWNLLGDPELNCWTQTPSPITVIHDTIIPNGLQNYLVTVSKNGSPLPNALVCVMMDTTVYQYNLTNDSGKVSFNINVPVGTMSVTVTAQNCIPYEKDVIVQPGGLEHDVSVYGIIEPIGIIASGITVYPKVKLINYGSHTDTFAVTFKIGSVYNQTINQVILAAGDTVTKQFPGWTSVYGNYSIKAWTSLASDQWHGNDTAFGNLNVLYGKDVGIDSILCPDTFHVINTEMIPQVKVKNYGALAQSNFPVVCSIVSITGSVRYTNTQIISLGAQKDTIVNFSAWTPTINEKCSVKIRTALVGDANSVNDRKMRFTDIVPVSQIVIGNGTATSRFPLDRYYNYSVHEAIYLQSEINTAGNITHIGYYKASGDDVNPIENVQIYLKHTEATTLATGTFSLDGYTLVFSGSFTNNATSGWMKVPLTTPFYYNNSDNLQILIRKGYQQWINNYPQWCYTSTSPNYRTRQAYSDQNEPTNLTQTYNRPNIQLTLTTIRDVGIMAIISPTEVVADSQLITPKAIVKNLGYKPETLSVTFKIGNDYSNTITNFILNAGATDTAIFSTNWLATIGTYQIKCYLHLDNGDFNPFNDTLQCIVTCRENYENNFETTNGNFSALPATGGWEWGVPTSGPNSAHSGTKLWATVLAGNYTNNANWKLISSEFIATSDNPQLKFWHWYNMEESPTIPGRAYDGGNVKISTDSGLNWSLIRPINGYNGIGYTTNAGIPGESCYTGVHETWQQATFNLPVLSGQKFMVCWHFGSDGGIVRSGWYLDDIVCTEVVSRYPNDVGCLSIQAPISQVDSGAVITPVAIIHNYSLNRLSFDVKFDISDGYSNIRNISAPPNSDTMISFAPWIANYFGTIVIKCSTRLTLDENSFNDKATSNVSVRFHDVGVFEITSPRDSVASANLPIIAKVKNFYIRTASCSTKFTIRNQNDSVIFEQKRFVANLLPESIQSINFGNSHLSPGKYYTKVWTILATDDNASNDTLADSVKVLLAVPALNLPANFSVLYTATPFFDWSDVDGASEYQIQIDNDNNFLSPEVDTIVASSQLQIQPPGLSDDTFFWRVRAGLPYNSFWSETRQFIINTAPTPSGWTQKEPIETSVPNAIKDGGAIVGVGNELYAFVGTKTNKFKKYTIGSKSGWSYTQSESLPFGYKYPTTTPSTINKKYPGKGAALCYDGVNTIYATRGNGTREFWSFNLTTRTWTLEESIPVPKGVKGGTALAFNDGKVYLLAGGQKKTDVNNFYVYDTTTRHWSVSAPLTLGSYNKPWKDGSCLAVCNGQIYALKGGDKHNLFYTFDGTAWSVKETMPMIDTVFGRAKAKVLVKAGGCMASDGSVIYAIKGGGTDCFWRYSPSSDLWQRLESIPVIDKKHAPKTGAAMAYAAGRVWLLVGNKKPDFWYYTIGVDKTRRDASLTVGSLMTNRIVNAFKFNFDVTPNPFNELTTICYTVPVPSKVIIKLYNSSGRLIKTLVDNYQNAGAYSLQLDNLNNGIYFVKYQDINNRKEIKLIKL